MIRNPKIDALKTTAVVLIIWPLFSGPDSAVAAPITTNTALPVSQDEFIFREKLVFAKSRDQFGGQPRQATGLEAVSVLGYGFTPKLAAFFILPTRHRKFKTPLGSREATGIGDASLFFRYTIYSRDRVGKTLRVAPFLGVKMPTGADDKADGSGVLPPPLQPGTGSWDVFGGIIATYASLDWNLDIQAAFQVNNRKNGFKRGNVFRGDVSFQYRLLPGKIDRDTKGFLYGVIEANLIHQEKNSNTFLIDQNTGGTTFFIVPGIQYAVRRWIAELAVQVPVVQDLNGTALGRDYVIHTGIRINF